MLSLVVLKFLKSNNKQQRYGRIEKINIILNKETLYVITVSSLMNLKRPPFLNVDQLHLRTKHSLKFTILILSFVRRS